MTTLSNGHHASAAQEAVQSENALNSEATVQAHAPRARSVPNALPLDGQLHSGTPGSDLVPVTQGDHAAEFIAGSGRALERAMNWYGLITRWLSAVSAGTSLLYARPKSLAATATHHRTVAGRHSVPVVRYSRLAYGCFHLAVKAGLNAAEWVLESPVSLIVAALLIVGAVVFHWL